MSKVSVHAAKSGLSELIRRAETGEEIEITRHGVVVARLVGKFSGRKPGSGVGTVQYHDDFEFTDSELDDLLDTPSDPLS